MKDAWKWLVGAVVVGGVFVAIRRRAGSDGLTLPAIYGFALPWMSVRDAEALQLKLQTPEVLAYFSGSTSCLGSDALRFEGSEIRYEGGRATVWLLYAHRGKIAFDSQCFYNVMQGADRTSGYTQPTFVKAFEGRLSE